MRSRTHISIFNHYTYRARLQITPPPLREIWSETKHALKSTFGAATWPRSFIYLWTSRSCSKCWARTSREITHMLSRPNKTGPVVRFYLVWFVGRWGGNSTLATQSSKRCCLNRLRYPPPLGEGGNTRSA